MAGDHQIDWQAILNAAMGEQARHATILAGLESQIKIVQAQLGDHGPATDHLSNISVKMVQGAARSRATSEVLAILRQAKNEQMRAVVMLENAIKSIKAAYAYGLSATIRIKKAADEIGNI